MTFEKLNKLLEYTKDIDIIKKINEKDDYLIDGILDFIFSFNNQNKFILNNISYDNQLNLLRKILESPTSDHAWDLIRIFSNDIVLENRTVPQLILLSEILNQTEPKYLHHVYDMIVGSSNVLENITFEQQLEAINILKKKKLSTVNVLKYIFTNKDFSSMKDTKEYNQLISSIVSNTDEAKLQYLYKVISETDTTELKDRLNLLNCILTAQTTLKGKAIAIILFHNDKDISLEAKEKYIKQLMALKQNNEDDIYNFMWEVNQTIERDNKKTRNNSISTDSKGSNNISISTKTRLQLREEEDCAYYRRSILNSFMLLTKCDLRDIRKFGDALKEINNSQALRGISICFNYNDGQFFKYRTIDNATLTVTLFKDIDNIYASEKMAAYVYDTNVLQNRDFHQQLEIIKDLITSYIKKSPLNADKVLLDQYLLSHRSHEEVMKLFNKLKANVNTPLEKIIESIILDNNLKKKYTTEEQLQFIKKVEDADTLVKSQMIGYVFTDVHINNNENFQKQLQMANQINNATTDIKAEAIGNIFKWLALCKSNGNVDSLSIANQIHNTKTDNIATYMSKIVQALVSYEYRNLDDKTIIAILNGETTESTIVSKKIKNLQEQIMASTIIHYCVTSDDLVEKAHTYKRVI